MVQSLPPWIPLSPSPHNLASKILHFPTNNRSNYWNIWVVFFLCPELIFFLLFINHFFTAHPWDFLENIFSKFRLSVKLRVITKTYLPYVNVCFHMKVSAWFCALLLNRHTFYLSVELSWVFLFIEIDWKVCWLDCFMNYLQIDFTESFRLFELPSFEFYTVYIYLYIFIHTYIYIYI